jgi:DNA-binding transcriptional regulator YhcF (GntR family)
MKKKPGLQKAVNFILKGLDDKSFSQKLPSIKSLAQAADVSFVTMWKAIDHLKKQGAISRQGKGILSHVNSAEMQPFDAAPPQGGASDAFQGIDAVDPLWKKTLMRLKRDVLTGRFPVGHPLPSFKELQGQYDVSYPTLKKALETLSSEGIIRPFQRVYSVPALSKSESTARIVAIGCGWEDGTLWIDHQDKNYFRILESECIQSKISLDIVVYCRLDGRLCFIDTITRKPYDLSGDNILSIMVIVANLGIQPEEVLQNLVGLKKPIAVLDVVGGWEVSSRTANNYYLRFFTVTTSEFPPRQVARHLLTLGHTDIAFVSPFHKALWSIRRGDAIRDTYRDAGQPDSVHFHVLDDYAFQWDFLQENGNNQEEVQALVAAYDRWQKYADSEFFRKFGHISYSISRYLTEWNCATGEIYHRMVPLFKQALQDKAVTAWVMANDYTATLALDYLKEKKVRVPEDLSIISFDNTLDAMENHLTSYDFNLNGIVSIMLRYALRPSSVSPSPGKSVIEAEGAIVERRSTARFEPRQKHKTVPGHQ